MNKNIMTKLSDVDFVVIKQGDTKFYGGNQNWYERFTMRYGGCGPVALANIFAYKANYHDNCQMLAPITYDGTYTLKQFKTYSEQIYHVVRPYEIVPFNHLSDQASKAVGLPTLGVPTGHSLIAGAKRYAKMHKKIIRPVVYSDIFCKQKISDFVIGALQKDQPIALLNRFGKTNMRYKVNGGKLNDAVYERHWVTITGHHHRYATNEIEFLVSTWGCRATISLDELVANQKNRGNFLPPVLVYFD